MKFLSGSQQCFNNFELHSIYMRLKHLPQYDLLTYIYFVLFRPWADGGPHAPPPPLLTFFGIFIYPWVCGLRKNMLTGKILGPKVPPHGVF